MAYLLFLLMISMITNAQTNPPTTDITKNGMAGSQVESLTAEKNAAAKRAKKWNSINLFATGIAAALATFVVFAQLKVFLSNEALSRKQEELSSEKDRLALSDSKNKDIEIQKAHAEAGRANEAAGAANANAGIANQQAALANERAAKANEEAAKLALRAADLEKEAAVARLGLEKLKANMAWRSLDIHQYKKLSVLLKKSPGKFRVTYADDNPEQKRFAGNIKGSFINGGWTDVGEGIKSAPSSPGLFEVVIFGTPWTVNFVHKAFEEIGIASNFGFGHGIPIPANPTDNEEIEIRVCEKTPYPWADSDK